MTRRQRQAWWPSFAVLVALLLGLTGGAGAHHPDTSGARGSGVLTSRVVATHVGDPALATPRLTADRGHLHQPALATAPTSAAPRSGSRAVVLGTVAPAHSTRTDPGLSRAPPAARL